MEFLACWIESSVASDDLGSWVEGAEGGAGEVGGQRREEIELNEEEMKRTRWKEAFLPEDKEVWEDLRG